MRILALLVGIRLALLPTAAQDLLQLAGSAGPTVVLTTVTQDFNAYAPGVSLATLPGWTVPRGAFQTTSPAGGAYPNLDTGQSVALYEPSGFTTPANHQVEALFGGTTGVSSPQNYGGIAIAVQPGGACYVAYMTGASLGSLYFGYNDGATAVGTDFLSLSVGTIPTPGVRIRLSVTGTAATRVCTCEYNNGAGWVTPVGWLNRDFGSGKRLDAGKGGIAGYHNLANPNITSLTITGLATPEVTQNFNSYTAGVNLGTLPDWGAPYGAVLTIAGGTVASNVPAAQSFAIYKPTGFVAAAEHQVEVTYAAAANGAGSTFQGPVAAAQPDGSGYMAELDDNGFLYFGTAAGGGIANYVTFDTGTGVPASTKVRLSAALAAGIPVCSCEYDIGGGWITPVGWGNKDFGAGLRFSGGAGGVAGYGNAKLVKMDSLVVRNFPAVTEATQDFNSYAPGQSLGNLPGWTVTEGSFITVAGGVTGDVLDAFAMAVYSPAGFITAPNHEVEGVVYDSVGGPEYHGIVCALQQPGGHCYALTYGASNLYFWDVSGWFPGLQVSIPGGIPSGLKLRLAVTGTGETRRVTASYDLNGGAGWVTPPGWQDKDWGPGRRLDGGKGGIVGYKNIHNMKVDSLTVRNLPPTEVTQDFNSYTPGDQLATYPGWTVVPAGVGKFKAGSAGAYSDVLNIYSAAGYAPAGFTIAPNHEVEGMVYDLGGAESYQGITCAFQPTGDCYILMYGSNAVYFWDWASGSPSGGVYVSIGAIPTGVKLRLSVTGSGENRRVTASYNLNAGAGWVTPAGWQDKDWGPGKRFDGGKGGIVGFSNTYTMRIDDLTIRNLPATEVIQNFDSYPPGVSLATVPGWTIFGGSWKVGASTVYSDTAGVWQTTKYDPPGFAVSPDHEAEMTIAGVGTGTDTAVAAALQANGSGYAVDTNGSNVVLGRILPGGGDIADYVEVAAGVGAGSKLRISVTGTGAARRVTGSYLLASGGGWVTPAGWANKDFGAGKRYDGGTGGLFGYGNARIHEAADLTIRNLPPSEVTQDFNSYAAGVQLATLPGWTVVPAGTGKFITGDGGVTGDALNAYSAAGYSPAGFVTAPNHEVECMIYAPTLSGTLQGITCAFQPTGDCYILMIGAPGVLDFYWGSGGAASDGLALSIGAIDPNGLKLRLRVTGTGETRRVTASFDRNEGAGWVTPYGWQDRDFGPGRRLDGGKGGILGYSNTHNAKIDSLTIRNLPATEVTQDFSSYTTGASLATVPGWTIFGGTWKAGTSTVYSDTAATWQTAKYDPPGFTVSANHEVEMTTSVAGAAYLAVAAAVQTDGSGYALCTDGLTAMFGWKLPGAGGFGEYMSVDTSGVTTGTKLRLSVTGTGENRRVTGSYMLGSGGGWVTPSGWLNRDWGVGLRYDGGTGGLFGHGNSRGQEAADLTIRNLPPDPPPQPPTAGLLGWWKADSILSHSPATVATWQDSHTTDHDMVQATEASWPIIQTSQMNGLPVLRFDGVDDFMQATMSITGSTVTSYMVLKVITGPTGTQRISSIAAAEGTPDYNNDASAVLGFVGASYLSTLRNGAGSDVLRPANGIAFVHTVLFDGANNTAYANGIAGTSVASTGSFGGNYFSAGGGAGGGAPYAPSNIDLAELLIYNVAHDAATRKSIGTYLSSKWGTPPPP